MILNKVFVTIIYTFLFIIILSLILLLFLNKEIHKPLEIFDDVESDPSKKTLLKAIEIR